MKTMRSTIAKFCLVAGGLMLAVAMLALAQADPEHDRRSHEDSARVAQVVALDECDPATFNAALGPDFCKNIALGYSTTFSNLFAEAAAGTPDPNWDFEPDTLKIKEGTIVSVVDQGGEPHTFTEVANFGGGFIAPSERRTSNGSRMCRRLFKSCGGQDPASSRQLSPDHGPVERRTSFRMLYPSLDAHERRSEITSLTGLAHLWLRYLPGCHERWHYMGLKAKAPRALGLS